MCPVLRILGFSVTSYGLLVGLGAALGFGIFYLLMVSKYPRGSKYFLYAILYSIVLGFLGARITYIAVNEPQTLLQLNFKRVLFEWDGLAVHGALLWVFCFAFVYRHWVERRLGKENVPTIWEVGDAAAVAVPVGVFLGRLGCWFNGCCWGIYYQKGVVFPQLSGIPPLYYHAFMEYPRYPVQLYASLFNLGVFLLMLLLYSTKLYPEGELFVYFILLYSYGRTIWDYLRWDETAVLLFNGRLTVAQLASIAAILIIYSVALVKRLTEGKRREENASGPV